MNKICFHTFQPNPRKLLSGAASSLTDNDGTIDPKNFATIRTTSIVQRQQKEHLQVKNFTKKDAVLCNDFYPDPEVLKLGLRRSLPNYIFLSKQPSQCVEHESNKLQKNMRNTITALK